jgi:hypothetical protein
MHPTRTRAVALVLAAAVAACGGSKTSDLPPDVWTWISVAGAVCSDGSQTGIAIERPAAPSAGVVVFLMGGGACWDTLSCFFAGTATPGPFGAAQMQQQIPQLVPGSIFDRSVASNPYKAFTFVFVPYCTGDVHAGDKVGTAGSGAFYGAPRDWRFKGRVNLAADFAWLGANLDAPSKVVVAGSSAGGFGSLHAFVLARTTWPAAKGYLVDDSGPPLREIPPATVAAWQLAWDLGGAMSSLCGALDCLNDLSLVFPALQTKYPNDRLALLSSTQDATIRGFFTDVTTITTTPPYFTPMSPTTFEDGLRALASRIEDDTPPGETHAFLVTGTSHTMLGAPASFTSQGTSLWDWLKLQVNDDPAWAAAIPP